MLTLAFGTIIDLDSSQRVIEWGFFRITVANLMVVLLMAAVFVLAVLLPFPKGRKVEAGAEPLPAEDEGSGWTAALRRLAQRDLPWSRLLPSSEPSYVASWTYTFGVATLAALAAIAVSGTVLAVGGPVWRHRSSFGMFVDDVHLWSVQLFFFFVVLHLVAQFLQATWRGRRGLTWVTGAITMLASIITALTGYVSQQNFEAQWIATEAKDGFNALGVGSILNLLDTGQVLTIHVLALPLTVSVVLAVHILLVRQRGVCPPIPEPGDVPPAVGAGARALP
jgi:hypothetical protein